MKTLTKRKPGADKAGRRGDIGGRLPAAAIRDGSGAWSAGLWNEENAALLGRIAGSMPQVEDLMADLTARLLGDPAMPGRAVFRGLAGDTERVKVLRTLLEQAPANIAKGADFDTAISGYAGARRRWRAYLHGLWYTHENGRTFLAAPGGSDAATFLVAREVRTAELQAELARLTELGAALVRLTRPEAAARAPAAAPPGAKRKPRPPEAGKAGRAAPKREAGKRRRMRTTQDAGAPEAADPAHS
jgi:hypothetical protein